MRTATLRVVVLYNRPVLAPDHPEYDAEEWVRTAAVDIAGHLRRAGHEVIELGIGRELARLPDRLAAMTPDVVLNLFEGHADRPVSEIAVARLLERRRIAFTGSPGRALWLSLNKHHAKSRLAAQGLSVPWSMVAAGLPPSREDYPWPVIVKPARRDSSEGITQESVVTQAAGLCEKVGHVIASYGSPALIEEFMPGREFTVGLIEEPRLRALPITEVVYAMRADFRWPILSYAAKWLPDSIDYAASDMHRGVNLPQALSKRLVDLACGAYRAVGCRDYARVDLRLSASGEPMVLEVNANPDLSPTACFAKAMETAGIDRGAFLNRLVARAAARGRQAFMPARV
jgi:D-alanine-D-alanine ligase